MGFQNVQFSDSLRIKSGEELREATKEFREVVDEIDKDADSYICVFSGSDRFGPIEKGIKSLMDARWIYSVAQLQRRVELIEEYKEIVEAVEKINKIVRKRKKIIRKQREERGKR